MVPENRYRRKGKETRLQYAFGHSAWFIHPFQQCSGFLGNVSSVIISQQFHQLFLRQCAPSGQNKGIPALRANDHILHTIMSVQPFTDRNELPRLIPWNQLGFLFLRILLEYSRGSTSPAIPFNGNYLCFLSLLFNRLPSASCGSDGPVRIPDAGLP